MIGVDMICKYDGVEYEVDDDMNILSIRLDKWNRHKIVFVGGSNRPCSEGIPLGLYSQIRHGSGVYTPASAAEVMTFDVAQDIYIATITYGICSEFMNIVRGRGSLGDSEVILREVYAMYCIPDDLIPIIDITPYLWAGEKMVVANF